MSMTVIQAGATLQIVDEDGNRTTLTLPANVTLSINVPPRWTVYGRNVVLVNTPSQPLTIDSKGTVRLLTPKPPRLAPILAGVNGGTLSGAFKVKETFVVLDQFGNILSESDYGPTSTKVAIAAKFLGASNLDVSPDSITLRRLYRTTDQGAVFFQWVDADGNVVTTIQDDLPDAGLSIFSAPVLGTPPRLTAVASFRGRLFGVGDQDIDNVRYTEAGVQYAWPVDNLIPIEGKGSDGFGIVGFLPRKEALGVGRRNVLSQITGTGTETGTDIDFDPVIISRELGIESQESVCVYRDTVYFLWKDGVYSWGPGGIVCVSDGSITGKGNVRSWFVSDDFFNKEKYTAAFAHVDPDGPTYRLFLCSAGSDTIDRWVEYDLDDKVWMGPHKTGLFTPTSAFHRTTAADTTVPLIGGPAAIFEEQVVRTDGFNTPIEFDVVGKRHDMQVPDTDKYFGEVSIMGRGTPGLLAVKTIAGELNATRTTTQQYDQTRTRQRLGRPGKGKHMEVELVNSNVGEDVKVLGYEVDPVNLLGRR